MFQNNWYQHKTEYYSKKKKKKKKKKTWWQKKTAEVFQMEDID